MTDSELEKMAAKIVTELFEDFGRPTDPRMGVVLQSDILKALRIVRDYVTENLEKRYKSQIDVMVKLPSDEEITKASQFRIVNPEVAPEFAKVMMAMKKAEWLDCVNWLRSKIKTLQPISDEELERIAKSHISGSKLESWEAAFAYIAFENGFRAAERHHGIK